MRWLFARRERLGGGGTFSGRKACVGDLGIIGPDCPAERPKLDWPPLGVSFTGVSIFDVHLRHTFHRSVSRFVAAQLNPRTVA